MQDLTDDDRRQVLGEILMDELKALREGISMLPTRQEFKKLEEKFDKMSDDIDAIKSVTRNHSSKLQNHEQRLVTLEQSA